MNCSMAGEQTSSENDTKLMEKMGKLNRYWMLVNGLHVEFFGGETLPSAFKG